MFDFFRKKNSSAKISNRRIVIFSLAAFITTLTAFFFKSGMAHAQVQAGLAAAGAATGLWSAASEATSFLSITPIFIAMAQAMLHLTSWVLWAAAEILQAIIEISILNIDTYVNSDGVLSTWQTFRDLANMAFIFIIMYCAINIILGTNEIALKKLLPRIIIVAVLINFSMFFTRVALDASNILTISFYNQIINTSCGTATEPAANLGAIFACKMGLTSFWDVNTIDKIMNSTGGGVSGAIKILTMGIMGSVFFLVAAFVFLAACLMFLKRFLEILYIFIISPIAFASYAIPDQGKTFDKWVGKLIGVVAFPPAFMLAIWVSLKVMNTVAITVSESMLVDAVIGVENGRPAPGAGEVILNYAIVIGLMAGSLIAASKFGAYGADSALKRLKSAGRDTQGWIQGKLGRGTVRGLGIATADKKFGDSEFGKSWYGSPIRAITTGKAVNYNFGSKYSVASIDKAREASQKDLAKGVITKEEKDFEKEELPGIRMKSVAALGDTLSAKNTELTQLNKNIEKLQKTIKDETKALEDHSKTAGMPIPTSDTLRINEMVSRLNEMKSQVKTIETETKKTSAEIKTTTDNMTFKAPATKQEKGTAFVERLGRKAVEMSTKSTSALASVVPGYQRDRNAVVKELKKKADELKAAARSNKKDAKEAVRELLDELEGKKEGAEGEAKSEEKKEVGGEKKEGGKK